MEVGVTNQHSRREETALFVVKRWLERRSTSTCGTRARKTRADARRRFQKSNVKFAADSSTKRVCGHTFDHSTARQRSRKDKDMCQNEEAASIIVSNKAGEQVGELLQDKNAFAKWRRNLAPQYPNQRLGFVVDSSDGVQIVDSPGALRALKLNGNTKAELVSKVALPTGRTGDAWKCS